MNVLYLTYDGLTDNLGQSQVIPYLKGLAKKGHAITILSVEKRDAYGKSGMRIKKELDEVSIKWQRIAYHNTIPVFSPLYILGRLVFDALRITSRQKIEIIHCRSYIPAMAGRVISKRTGSKLLFDMRGFWADERIEGNIWKLSNPIYKHIYHYVKKQEKKLLLNASHIISLTEDAKNCIEKEMTLPARPAPVTVIPCCADLALFDSSKVSIDEINNKKEQLGIDKNDFVLTYVGSIGTWYLLPEMLRFFRQLQEKITTSVFLLITKDPSELILAVADQLKIDKQKIKIIAAERKEVPSLIATSNMSIFFIKPSFSKRASSPTKQGETLAMGIPIICNKNIGDTDRFIKHNNLGYIVDDFSEQGFQKVIAQIVSGHTFNKESITESARLHFSLQAGIESYDKVYKQMIF